MAVPLDSSPSPHAKRALHNLEVERKYDSEGKISGWTFVWTLFVFKMVTVAMIWYAAKGAPDATGYITVTTWYWFSIPAIAVSGFIGYRLRLRKMRKKADELRRAEFMDNGSGQEPWILTDDELRKLMALEARHHRIDHPGEG